VNAVEVPVPPYATPIVVAFQTPVAIVPTLVKLDNVATAELTSVPEVGRVTFVAALAVSVTEYAPDVASVDPSASVSVAPTAGAVTATLL
jgi:hypothetical protein